MKLAHLAFVLAAGIGFDFAATAAVDPNAPVVFVEKDCGTQHDCFETMADLTAWITATRQPTAGDPLLVDVGPGEFDSFDCFGDFGHTTLRGSGREQTRVVGADIGMQINDCDALEFLDLTVVADVYGVFWTSTGSSTWTDVDVIGGIGAWYGWGNCGDDDEHYWFGSRLVSRVQPNPFVPSEGIGTAYFSQCPGNWLYGSEVAALGQEDSPTTISRMTGISVSGDGDVRLFGSTVRVSTLAMDPSTTVEKLRGVVVGAPENGANNQGRGVLHMHGGIISVVASNLGAVDATGLKMIQQGGGTAFAHTPDTAFTVQPGQSGRPRRVVGTGAQSPFLWPAGPEPPANLESVSGYDLFVETDCTAAGNCEASGSQSHLMVYDTSCSAAWRDVVTGRCRNDTGMMQSGCGFGYELAFFFPVLIWLLARRGPGPGRRAVSGS